jgi:hypothetical protein
MSASTLFSAIRRLRLEIARVCPDMLSWRAVSTFCKFVDKFRDVSRLTAYPLTLTRDQS